MTTQMKILADATISNISSASSSCEVAISNIQEYSNFSKLPEYLYVIVDYSKEIGTPTNTEMYDPRNACNLPRSLKHYDRNIALITNSRSRIITMTRGDLETHLNNTKMIPDDYKKLYGIYKLMNGSYYVKMYKPTATTTPPMCENDAFKINILLMYNGSSWVFYAQTKQLFKDFLYVKMFLKNDIENYITTDFDYIAENKTIKNSANNYKIIFTDKLPEDVVETDIGYYPINNNLIIPQKAIPDGYFNEYLNIDTSKLITT